MRVSRHNTGLKMFLTGRRARDLHGLTDLAGDVLKSHDRAVTRAKAGVVRRAEPAVKRNVTAVYNIKASQLAGKYRVQQGRPGKTVRSSELLTIWASIRPLSLLLFGGMWRRPMPGKRATSAGATAQIVRGHRKTYDSAFIATVGWRGTSGNAVKADTASRGIYVRSFNGGLGKRHGRGPLRRLHGPSPYGMLVGTTDLQGPSKIRSATVSELTAFYLAELRRQWKLNRTT